jgi:uncharacterized protein YodC (DUF2158 family)
MNQIKLGDVVQLKSGGPRMTVAEVGTTAGGVPSAWCDWFEGNKPLKSTFPIQSLERVEE